MKYLVYIDYRTSHKPLAFEYRVLDARTISEAIVEADRIWDDKTMYLAQVMEKRGRAEKVESDIKALTYAAILEKRSTSWAIPERNHAVKHFVSKYGEWFETV